MVKTDKEAEIRDFFINSDFSENLIILNKLNEHGFERWGFYPGMLFGSREKWWGDWKERVRAHEGLDLCFYTDRSNKLHRLGLSTKVCTMLSGTVSEIVDDLLGKSVFIKHDKKNEEGKSLFTIYSHINPVAGIEPGKFLNKAEIIANIAETKEKNPELPPHLHISIAWLPASLEKQGLNWNNLNSLGSVVFIDPLKLIRCDYTTLKRPDVT